MVLDQNFKRLEEESEEDYQIRICSLREEYRLTWDEIARIINKELDLNYTESRYRKQYAAYLKGLKDAAEIQENKEFHIDDEIEMTFSKEEQEYRERYALSTGKIGYYRLLRQDSRFARFYKMIAQEIKHLDPPNDLNVKREDHVEDREWVMTLADLHIGACFESVNNSYSVTVAKERFEKLLSKLIVFCEEKKLRKLNILSLGDTVQGILRIGDLKTNEMAVVDAFVTAMRLIADFLNKLSTFVEIDFYQVCYSNHDQLRPLGTKASELAAEDMGKILFAYLTDTLERNERVRIIGDTAHDYLEFNIYDFECIALHGHQIKTAHDVYKNLANRHHKFYDYIFLGHTHSMKTFVNAECKTHDAETLVSSSFVGSDPYADKLMVGSKAAVHIHEFAPIEGRVASYKIILN